MAAGKLTGLRSREVDAFFAHFAPGHKRIGLKVTGVGGSGPFAVHLDHSGGLTQQQLSRVLRYLGVGRAEFIDWYDSI